LFCNGLIKPFPKPEYSRQCLQALLINRHIPQAVLQIPKKFLTIDQMPENALK
jgi:hypothetical protein